MAGNSQNATDLGSLAGRASALGADLKQMQGRLNLRAVLAASTFAAAIAATGHLVHALRWLEVHERGGIAAPKEASRG